MWSNWLVFIIIIGDFPLNGLLRIAFSSKMINFVGVESRKTVTL